MIRENFENLLTDLFAIYNPSKISDISNVVDKYHNGQEFDAVKVIFLKYNYKANPIYDPNAGTDKHVKFLIDKYSSGERPLSNGYVNITKQQQEQEEKKSAEEKIEKVNETINDIASKSKEDIQGITLKNKEEIELLFNKKIEEVNQHFQIKEKELQQKTEQLILSITKNQVIDTTSQIGIPKEDIQPSNRKIQLKLNLNYTDSDLELPKEINEMAVGSRFLVYDSKKKIIALEIKDIIYDFISYEEVFTKDIMIDKANPEL